MVIRLHILKTNILVTVFIQLNQMNNKFKLKSIKMDQSKVLSLFMLIFFYTVRVFTNVHQVLLLVVMVCIFYRHTCLSILIVILLLQLLKFLVGVLKIQHHIGLLLIVSSFRSSYCNQDSNVCFQHGIKIGVIMVSSKSFVVKMNVVLKVVLSPVHRNSIK